MNNATLARLLNIRLEATQADLLNKMRKDDPSIAKSKGMGHTYIGINRDRNGDAVVKWNIPSQSTPGKLYDVFIGVIPKDVSLFALAQNSKGDIRTRQAILRNADVKCFCSCKWFNYGGIAYNLKHGLDSYSYDHKSSDDVPDGSDIPPDVRDPERKHVLCKHLVAAFKGMSTNATRIVSDAKKAKFPAIQERKADVPVASTNAPEMADGADARAEAVAKEFFMTKDTDSREPVDIDAGEILGESKPARMEAAQPALDALALAIEEPADKEMTAKPEDIGLSSQPVEEPDVTAQDIVGYSRDAIADVQNASNLSMFDIGLEPVEEDEE